MNRLAGLLRVSTDAQDLDSQREAIKNFARREGFESVVWFEEHVCGAASSRPVLDNLLKEARAGRFSVLCVAALDRIARDVVRLVLTLDSLEQAGVSLVSLREGFDFRGPMGRAMVAILGAVAEIERAAIRSRVKAGLAAAKARGVRLGKVPFVPSEEDCATILARAEAGETFVQIAANTALFDATGRARIPGPDYIRKLVKAMHSTNEKGR